MAGRVVACVLLVGCAFRHGETSHDAPVAPPPDVAPAPDAAVPLGPWGTPTALFSGGGDDDPTLTGDLLELYFNRNADIYMSTRTAVDQAWATPTLVSALSTTSNETTPEITYDGLTIFVASGRPGGAGADDIFFATRASRTAQWGPMMRVAELCTPYEDAASAPAEDLETIVWISNPTGQADIYIATRTAPNATWSAPATLASVNSTYNDFSPMLSADKLQLYFDSGRNGVDEDLYVASRTSTSDPFDTPVPITELDTTQNETDPWISPDNRHLFFERGGTLYESSR